MKFSLDFKKIIQHAVRECLRLFFASLFMVRTNFLGFAFFFFYCLLIKKTHNELYQMMGRIKVQLHYLVVNVYKGKTCNYIF